MKIAISMYSKTSDYGKLYDAMNGIKASEIFAVKHDLIKHYGKEFNIPINEYPILWGEVYGIPEEDIGVNKWGKEYDKNAPRKAMEKVIENAEAYVVVGKGDSIMNELAQKSGLKLLKSEIKAEAGTKTESGKYKF